MIGNLKALGLALCALCAFGALAASAASAATDSLTSGSTSGTTYLTGEQITGVNTFGSHTSSGTIKCETADYTGEYAGTAATHVEVTPSYDKCKIGAGEAKVTDNGCKFVLTGTTQAYKNTDGVAEGEDATVSLNCNDTGNITVDGPLQCVITFSDTHPAGTKVNQNLLGVKYENVAGSSPEDVKLVATVDNVVFTANGKCAALGFPATGTDGFLTTNVTVRAYSDSARKNQVNLTTS